MAELTDMKIKVLFSVPDLPDHVIRVLDITVEGERMIALAGYSLDAEVYGPIVPFSPHVLPEVMEALRWVNRHFNGRDTRPGSNQERLEV